MRSTPVRWALAGVAIALSVTVLSVSSGAATEKQGAPGQVNPGQAAPGRAAPNQAAFSRRNPVVLAVQKTRGSIVSIRVPRAGTRDMVGTGVIVDERGFVVTNRHVVGKARSMKVQLWDGTTLEAEVHAAETALDLAILKISSSKKLPALHLGPVSDLMIGESVIAIGHPFGYTNTVSTGIISALGREITMPTGDTLTSLIQTDASINPGNSGGPLLNINGELIGINVALREGAQGISFAINADTVKSFLSKHLNAQRVAGVDHGLNVREKVIAETGERQRVVVAECSAKACAKLQAGDEVKAIADRSIVNAFDVERAMWDKKPGQTVDLRIVRKGQELTVQLTLLPGQGAGQVAAVQGSNSRPAGATSGVPVGNRP
jgi:serine protease Do